MTTAPLRILFVCRHNSVRSQLAAALANKIGAGKVQALSAGPEPQPVSAAVADFIARLTGCAEPILSHSLDDVAEQSFDLIITLCDRTHQAIAEHPRDDEHLQWDFPAAVDAPSLQQLEIELSERIRLLLLARHLI